MMKVKTAIVEKSLYDIINENLTFIISFIINIVILNYNHYTLNYMKDLTNDKFVIYSVYIQICQYITLLALFLSVYCKNNNSQLIASITIWSIIIKSIIAVYTYGNIFSFLTLSKEMQNLLDEMNNDVCQYIIVFNTIFITIVNMFMFVLSFMIVLAYLVITFDKLYDITINWCKSFKIKYTSQRIIKEEEV